MRNVNCNAIGYLHNPEPLEPDQRDDAIAARFDEIWADADLLCYALDDASLPLSLQTCTLLRDASRRLQRIPAQTDAEKFVLALMQDVEKAVLKAATDDVDEV